MPDTNRIASAHESFVHLLRAIDPKLLIRIACEQAGLEVREIAETNERTPKIEISGFTKAARSYEPDLVYTVHTTDGQVFEIWIHEIQLSYDELKRWLWALYPVAYSVEFKKESLLAVFCPHPELRERLRTKLIPKIQPKPLLIERDRIELITDYNGARERPELAVLSAVYHAHGPGPWEQRVAAVRAAYVGIQGLADVDVRRYAVLIMSTAPKPVVDQALQELEKEGHLDNSRYELVSETERTGHSFLTGFEEGEQKGRQEGREEGLEQARALLRQSLVDVLELRGFTVTLDHHQRIRSCALLDTLERWYAAAKGAAANRSLDELLV